MRAVLFKKVLGQLYLLFSELLIVTRIYNG